SGADQYKPGYGFGDPNHNHNGPPGVKPGNAGGKRTTALSSGLAPLAAPKVVGSNLIVSTSVTLDEQAQLAISVIDKKTGKELLIKQASGKQHGVQAT